MKDKVRNNDINEKKNVILNFEKEKNKIMRFNDYVKNRVALYNDQDLHKFDLVKYY